MLPRIRVGKQQFRHLKHDLSQGLTVPDTSVGRRSVPNEVNFDATEETGATKDYALDDPVPQIDIENAPPNHNPLNHAVMTVTDLIMLDREIRAANLVFDGDQYSVGNKLALSGTDQWSDFANSHPIDDITAAPRYAIHSAECDGDRTGKCSARSCAIRKL